MFWSPEGLWERTPCGVRLAVCAVHSWGWVHPAVRTAALMVPLHATQYIPCVIVKEHDAAEEEDVRIKLFEGFTGRGKYLIEADPNCIIRNRGHLVLQL